MSNGRGVGANCTDRGPGHWPQAPGRHPPQPRCTMRHAETRGSWTQPANTRGTLLLSARDGRRTSSPKSAPAPACASGSSSGRWLVVAAWSCATFSHLSTLEPDSISRDQFARNDLTRASLALHRGSAVCPATVKGVRVERRLERLLPPPAQGSIRTAAGCRKCEHGAQAPWGTAGTVYHAQAQHPAHAAQPVCIPTGRADEAQTPGAWREHRRALQTPTRRVAAPDHGIARLAAALGAGARHAGRASEGPAPRLARLLLELVRPGMMQHSSSPPMTGTAVEAAIYMDRHLGDKVRLTLENCLQDKPCDPIRFFAHSLRQLAQQDAASNQEPVRAGAPAERLQAEPSKHFQLTASPSVRLENGVKYELRPLAQDFRCASGMPPAAEATAPPPVFPAVHYREAIPSYEVASCLRQLHMIDPVAPLLLFIECPASSSGAFFYQGVAYRCRNSTGKPADQTSPPLIAALQEALGAEKVGDFDTEIRAAAAEAAAAVKVNFLRSFQGDYLSIFDTLDDALKTATHVTDVSTADSPTNPPRWTLPSVLFVSYKPESAHLTYARLLASYGPLYEAAQRASLQAYRTAQMKRKRTYTFAYAREYWAKVQRQRHASSGAPRTVNSVAKWSSSVDSKTRSDQPTGPISLGDSATPITAAENFTAAKPVKRGLLTYSAAHQAEDDVFLIVVRRLEHAAATLIQSVYRGYRRRRSYTEAREALHCASGAVGTNSPLKTSLKDARMSQSSEDVTLPPLLRACLERLFREGDAFGSLWGDYVISPAPESRRCWIYRPVQHREGGGDTEQSGNDSAAGEHVREGWVQEELLLPPWRATQPRLHLNLFQRLRDYLALAQCTSLHENVQLLMDSPGMSVLQRRAYDGIKSVCLNLFHVAYAELRQRHPKGLPTSFSAYMRQMHGAVLGWLSTPHRCSLILRAVQTTTADAVQDAQQDNTRSRGVCSSHSATERSMSRVVRDQLAANEALLIAPHSLSASDTAAPAATLAEPTVLSVAPQLYISQQPLLPRNEWVQEVTALLQSTRDRSADAPSPFVEWMTTASFPLCCVDGTPVAAVLRLDTQQVEGAPPYDSFVPRLGGDTRQLTGTRAAEGAAAGDSVAPASLAVQAAAAVQEWMQGDLACAADAGLKHHIQESLFTESGMVYYRARVRKDGTATEAFTTVSPSATLVREVLRQNHKDSAADPCEGRTGHEVSTPPSELSGSVSASANPWHRSVRSSEEWDPVIGKVAQESSSAARRSCSCTSSIVTASRTSAGAFNSSRTTAARASINARLEMRSLAVLPNVELEATGELSKHAFRVLTADDVAKEVSAALSESPFKHTRVSMRFFAGPTVLEHLDTFLDRVAEALQKEAHSPSLVLAMDLPSQSFYALAAALLAFRLHDMREIPVRPHKKSRAAPEGSPSAQLGGVPSDVHVPFLSAFHNVLEAALPTPSGSRTAMQSTAVQTAIQHVSHVMNCAPLPQLNLVGLLRSAVQEAEAAIKPSHAIVRATQLAEQYALLVLLDYYLWSSQSCFTPAEPSLGSRSGMVRMVGNCAFAAFVSRVPAALEWMAHVDPWKTSSPDPLHLRYSNALRRWDDKHYVCYGAF
ncbi:hypothetical protein CGC21_6890 [Leishmania donovani]|uniref:Uncharacterized protein n=2 Tax=Leishmania donovani TaxID=5661 RepID=A0A504XAB8_LEIDO|nr:hypothetical protein CGC21_6890 [Leishmania donovani]